MNLSDFQPQALSQALYPLDKEVTFYSGALFGEIGEIAEIVDLAPSIDELSELGDVMFYTAVIANKLGIHLNESFCMPPPTLNHQRKDTLIEMVRDGGRLANHLKKAGRDGIPINHDLVVRSLRGVINSVVTYIAAMNGATKGVQVYTLQDVLSNCLDKLTARKAAQMARIA